MINQLKQTIFQYGFVHDVHSKILKENHIVPLVIFLINNLNHYIFHPQNLNLKQNQLQLLQNNVDSAINHQIIMLY